MRYKPNHKAESRRKLLDAAGALARSSGFAATPVDGFASAAGLTGGAFYNHFPSKSALLRDIVRDAMESSLETFSGADAPDGVPLARRLRRYLSHAHVENPETGCALPSLGGEIARAPAEVRRDVEATLTRIVAEWEALKPQDRAAWGLLAQSVGTILLARMVDDPETRDAILRSARAEIPVAFEGDRSEPS